MSSEQNIPTKALTKLPDGTVKQRNLLTGTQVWTVPGRGHRPLSTPKVTVTDLPKDAHRNFCPFCPGRYNETPPEKSRIIKEGDNFTHLRHVSADNLFDTTAEFRRIPNLFEIVSYNYWHLNHGHNPTSDQRQHMAEYLSTAAGFDHVMTIVGARLRAMGLSDEEIGNLDEAEMLSHANGFFSGAHDVIIAKRHFVDGATNTSDLASSGTLSVDEHEQYTAYTAAALEDLYHYNPAVKYVVAFQNWLKPAGASFDHLHKQLVAIDEHSVQVDSALEQLHKNPHIYKNIMAVIASQGLLLARNDHAVAIAGFGHRYPSVEIWPTGPSIRPWEASPEQVKAVSDLLHAMHAATGPDVPCNEEWYHCPIDVSIPMRWRVLLKWRISTLAGFEGGSRIYLNTINPWELKRKIMPQLYALRDAHQIAQMQLGEEATIHPDEFADS